MHGPGGGEEVLVRVDAARAPAASSSIGHGSPTGIGAMRSRSSSMAVEPHRPHAVVVADSRGAGTGAAPPVSTLTTLNSLSTALPVPQ